MTHRPENAWQKKDRCAHIDLAPSNFPCRIRSHYRFATLRALPPKSAAFA